MKTPCKLLIAFILSFSLFCLPAFADDDYEISTLSVLSQDYLGYVGFYNSGNDEWDYVINYIESLNLDSYDGYLIRSDSNGDIDILYDFSRWDSSDGSAYFSKIGLCLYSIADATYECSSKNQSNYHVFEQAPIFAMKLNQPSYWSNIKNWNAVDVTKMIEIYESGITDETQAIIDAINNQTDVIINGDDSTSDSVDSADDLNLSLQDKIDEFDALEQSYISDFNDNLADIDISGFNWDSSFLTSAAWVTTQFNELVMETPFENLITFSLIIGICLFLIGRYRGV